MPTKSEDLSWAAPADNDNEIMALKKLNALLYGISGETNPANYPSDSDKGGNFLKKSNQLLFDRWQRGSPPSAGGGTQSEIVLSTGTLSLTLAVDPATGDLIVYNSDKSKSINITQGFIGSTVVLKPPQGPTAPTIDSISPASVSAGSPDTVITFTGSGFNSNMRAAFGDHLMSWTTQMQSSVFDSDTQIRGTLGANLLANPTEFFLFIVTAGGQDSNNLPFEVV